MFLVWMLSVSLLFAETMATSNLKINKFDWNVQPMSHKVYFMRKIQLNTCTDDFLQNVPQSNGYSFRPYTTGEYKFYKQLHFRSYGH